MKNLDIYKDRFFKLLESELGNVKPIINEQEIGYERFLNRKNEQVPYSSQNTQKPKQKTIQNINPKNLKLGDGGKNNPQLKNDVIKLQQTLINLGCLKTDTGRPTGYFGTKTNAALQNYNKLGKCETTTKTKSTEKTKPSYDDTHLEFDGDYLTWYSSGKKVKSWNAVSGLSVYNAKPEEYFKLLKSFFQNKDSWSKEKNAGPIPKGNYVVGPLETRSGDQPEISGLVAIKSKLSGELDNQGDDFNLNTMKSKIGWGNYRLRINPTKGTDTYSRGDFYVHGGSLPGSHGCIDLTSGMEGFAKMYAAWSAKTGKKIIPLKVDYSKFNFNQLTADLVKLDKGSPITVTNLYKQEENLA